MNKKRMVNIEVLRVLAMMMVVMLHYLSKGQVLPPMTGSLDVVGYLAWMTETLCIVAVNVYMLISGYFLTESRFKTGRLAELLCQILFYSLLVPAVLICLGILDPAQTDLYRILQYVFPVQMEQYWFATAYVILYLLTPFLRTAVRHMKRKQLAATVLFLLGIMSLNKSVLPVRLTVDSLGYDALWFVCVFLCAAYIRLYGLGWFDSRRKSAAGYFACCAGILGFTLVIRALYLVTGKFEDYLLAAYHYNHILNLAAAVCLFYAFYRWEPGKSRFWNLIAGTAPYTFGVYLLHEQLEIRYLWPRWLGEAGSGVLGFLLKSLGSVLIVFAVGVAVDKFRSIIFRAAGKMLQKSRFAGGLKRIDQIINGELPEADSGKDML